MSPNNPTLSELQGIATQLGRRGKAASLILFYERDFKATGNPLFAWEAICLALDNELELPNWTLPYLKNVADSLTDTIYPKKDTGTACKNALGVDSGRQFTAFHNRQRDIDIYQRVHEKIKSGISIPEAFILGPGETSGIEISQKTVEKIYYSIRDEMEMTWSEYSSNLP